MAVVEFDCFFFCVFFWGQVRFDVYKDRIIMYHRQSEVVSCFFLILKMLKVMVLKWCIRVHWWFGVLRKLPGSIDAVISVESFLGYPSSKRIYFRLADCPACYGTWWRKWYLL